MTERISNGAASTAMEVISGIDLSRKLAIVTGGASAERSHAGSTTTPEPIGTRR